MSEAKYDTNELPKPDQEPDFPDSLEIIDIPPAPPGFFGNAGRFSLERLEQLIESLREGAPHAES